MELALSALVLLLILLPGYILQTAYTKGFWRWNSPTSNRSITEELGRTIVWSIVLHLIWASIASLIKTVRLETVLMILAGQYGKDSDRLGEVLELTTTHPYLISTYFLTLYLFSALAGLSAHSIVRQNKLDLKYRWLRFNNEWWYWLKGEIAEFTETASVDGKVGGVYLATVVHHGQSDYLYRGFVSEFLFDSSGQLDRVVLVRTVRRKLDNDRTLPHDEADKADKRFYPIAGDYFILRYSEMSTINLYFVTFRTSTAPPTLSVKSVSSNSVTLSITPPEGEPESDQTSKRE